MKNRFFKISLVSLALVIISCVFSYFFLDRSIAVWINKNQISSFWFFKWITYIATIVAALAAICIPIFSVLAVKQPIKKVQEILFLGCLSIAIASFLKDSLKILFGRYWIQTWTCQNPSLIEDHAYGFHFLHSGTAYESFPSGHTVIVFTALTFVWVFAPKWRFVALFFSFLEVFGLIAMNYHFLSDIISGAFLGVITSLFCMQIAKIHPKDS